MKIRFKSTVCETGEVVKQFKPDLANSVLHERKLEKKEKDFEGSIHELQLNHAFVLYQNYTNRDLKNAALEIAQSEPLYLLHFEMEGGVQCIHENKRNTPFYLERETYNLYYLPTGTRTYQYSSEKRKGLKVYLSEKYIHSKMGYCFTSSSKELHQAKKQQIPYAYFVQNQQIYNTLKSLINAFLDCEYQGAMKQAYLEAKLTELILVALTKPVSVKKEETSKQLQLEKVAEHIRKHLKKELNIADLSLLAGMNTSSFKRNFKQYFGTTVFKYITQLRIQKATELITQQDSTVAEASYEVGYKNPQHFTVAFKKVKGFLPSELKKNLSQLLCIISLSDWELFFIF
ncbi:helix-turn-helix domain-containing protein [Ochrovirga pacifica]|uniref:helix-turn-helix domain-containing protein n=1 Tax=Ochrovirga pacifica TaxID=1042376 RepID=UPI000255984B|nr:AraC family transcriptional regulator [Ochrovirga pacifica]